MTIVGFALNALLSILLVTALAFGVRLSRRLAALRESHDGFALAVRDLDAAARRAEQGLADLRAATDEAVDMLADRIEKGRELATRLERLSTNAVARAPARPEPSAAEARRAEALDRRAERVVAAWGRKSDLEFIDEDEDEIATPEAVGEAQRVRALGALLAASREARAKPERLVRREPKVAARTSSLDDDLFEDDSLTLDRAVGGAR